MNQFKVSKRKMKYWCKPCDFVAKNGRNVAPVCPVCGVVMRNMGDKWHVGKKGHRTDYVPQPVILPEQLLAKYHWVYHNRRRGGRIRSWMPPEA